MLGLCGPRKVMFSMAFSSFALGLFFRARLKGLVGCLEVF